MVFHPVETLDEVLAVALGKRDTPVVNELLNARNKRRPPRGITTR